MTSHKINNLEEILILNKNTEIITHKVTPLTAPGENYGSIMLKVDVTVSTLHGIDQIHLVAKVPPDEETQVIFDTPVTFRNEIAFYNIIVPILQNFQKEHGVEVVDLFPKYYGSRFSLNCDDSRIDANAVLLLENLRTANYKNMERTEGFDLNVARVVISDLALFHAVPLALRLHKKDVFDKDIEPYLSSWKMSTDFHHKTKKALEKTIDSIPEVLPLRDRILSGFDKKLQRSQCRESFATIIHNDFWVNNNMVKFEDTKPVKNKIVDLQECTFASLAKDLIFFLFASVQNQVLQAHYEDLIQIYYEKFIYMLSKLDCDMKLFSYEGFIKELNFEAEHSQFGHLMFMLYPIFAEGRPKCTAADLLDNEATELHKEKLVFIVKEFAKRNWI